MKTVTVYSTPTCPFCKMAKQFLKEKGIAFSDVDVAADEKQADAMIKKSGQMGVPVIAVADEGGKEEIIIGFDRAKLATAVGITL
ncbi:glutaredoxin family protein [Candidatus Uhrbacteria bacterium]|nr:glutaredoxin family protein [Candidatus Uhrbacteria bacterium]